MVKGEVDKAFLKKWYWILIVNKAFRILLMITTFIILNFTYFPDFYGKLYPIHSLDRLDINMLGFAILLMSLSWMVITQLHLSRKIERCKKQNLDSIPTIKEVFRFEENFLLSILIMISGVFVSISSLFALTITLLGIIIYLFYYISTYYKVG